jgi:hypothetical protein
MIFSKDKYSLLFCTVLLNTYPVVPVPIVRLNHVTKSSISDTDNLYSRSLESFMVIRNNPCPFGACSVADASFELALSLPSLSTAVTT